MSLNSKIILFFNFLALSMNFVSQGVRFSDNEMEKSSFGDTLVIINCSTERKDQVDNPKTGTLEDMHICFFHLEVYYKFIGFELNNFFCLGLKFLFNSSQTVICTKDCQCIEET